MPKRLEQARDFHSAKSCLYTIAHNVCNTGIEQGALVAAMQDVEMQMIRNGEDNKAIFLMLNGMIIDGLQYGNWPWIKNGVNTLA